MQKDYNLYSRAEKKSLTHFGNVIGSCLVIETILSVVASLVLSSVFSAILVLVFDCDLYKLIKDPIFLNTLNVLITFLCFFGIFYVMMKITHQPVAETVGTGVPKNKRYLPFLIGFAMLFAIIGSYFSAYIKIFFEKFFHVIPQQVDYGEVEYNAFTFGFIILCSAVMPALVEEFAFRGAILGVLRRFGDVTAIIVSSLMFSLMHGNFQQIPYTFCLAFGLGFLRCATDSIWPCVICHFLNNLIVLVQEILPDAYTEIYYNITYLVIIAFGLIGLAVIVKKKLFDSFYKPNLQTSVSTRVVRLIFSPMMLIAIVIYLVTAFQYFVSV